jgi:hypothetical protein
MKKTKNSNLNKQTKALIQKEKKDRQTNRNTTYRKRNMDQLKQAKFCAQKKWTDRQTDRQTQRQTSKWTNRNDVTYVWCRDRNVHYYETNESTHSNKEDKQADRQTDKRTNRNGRCCISRSPSASKRVKSCRTKQKQNIAEKKKKKKKKSKNAKSKASFKASLLSTTL